MGAENEIQTWGVKWLRARGYAVFVLSAPAQVFRQFAGLPDVWVIGPNTLWMIETKAPDGKLRDSQLKFFEKVRPFLGPNLRYSVPHSVQEIMVEAAQMPAVSK